MDFLYSDEPIVACSTGNNSNCAIAVIRLSGFKNFESFSHLLSLNFKNIVPRKAYYCDLVSDGKLIDQIVVTYFKGPHSYNGENIIELSVHGNILNVERIIDLFCENGFRHAHPGEFSYRALKNKKLNLSQVEGLDLLLNASSSFALDQGFSLMSGKLQESYINLQKSFLDHKSSVEFSIDFLEDMGEEQANYQLKRTLNEFKSHLEKLYHRVTSDSSGLLKPEIALLGQPNSGKSTFFNLLVKEERSIVTEIAGTTRDYISENINIANVHYRLVDTAGLRTSSDSIEMEGVKRSVSVGEKAFFKILLVNPFQFDAQYLKFLDGMAFDLVLYTHSDIAGFESKLADLRSSKAFRELLAGPMGAEKIGPMGAEKIGPMGAEKTGPMGAEKTGPMGAEKTGPMGAEKIGPMGAKKIGPMGAEKIGSIGAKETGSIGALKKINNYEWLADLKGESSALLNEVNTVVNNKYLSNIQDQPILLQRHKQKILEAKEMLEQYVQLLEIESDISIISSELNSIGHCISELVGIISPDDVLHNIFDNFCIGK